MKTDRYGLIIVDSTHIAIKISLILTLLLVIALTWFGVSWQLANMLAGFTKPSDENADSVARTLTNMSSRDPLVLGLLALAVQDQKGADSKLFEEVVRHSPRDYRWWTQLGRAYEQAELPDKAGNAYSYAMKIAPNYVVPKWQTGNFYLREGDDERALRVFGQAAPLDAVYRNQIFGVIWDYYDEDSAKLESIAGDDPESIAGLAKFYASRRFPEESLRAWKRLGKADRTKNKETAELIAQALFDRGYFRTSVRFAADAGIETGAAVGKVSNGGFESDILNSEKALFSWKTIKKEGITVQINKYNQHSGKRSLEVSFSGFDKPGINNIYQTVAANGGSRYRLRFWVKTERIASSGRPLIQIINAIDGNLLGSSSAFEMGSNDWSEYSVEFSLPAKSEGFAIRTSREYCGETCVLTGTFFYDDFELTELD